MTPSLLATTLAVALTAAFAAASPAAAHESIYVAPLAGATENPPNASPGTGQARVTIDFDTLMMRVEVSFANLVGNTTASHIHCCTASGNVGVATQLPTFDGFPLGVTYGSYDHSFDMAVAGSYNPAFITGHGGTVSSAFNALVAGLDAGQAYLNVHTSLYPGGELRGNLLPVPEPETWALMLAGFAGLAAWKRVRRGSA